MKIGYARVSTGLQNLNLQEDRLNTYGCEKIFNDHMSGSKSKRPGLDKAIEFARSGDTIVVWRLDRLGRNMEDLITLVNELNERGVSFHSLEENITMDKSSSTGQLLFHLFAAFAEFERNLILERSLDTGANSKSYLALSKTVKLFSAKIDDLFVVYS
ncbi:DNA-invertase hin [Staphylococcus aureus]|nr:DNA-invertase hin [Staphylococcus aureus]